VDYFSLILINCGKRPTLPLAECFQRVVCAIALHRAHRCAPRACRAFRGTVFQLIRVHRPHVNSRENLSLTASLHPRSQGRRAMDVPRHSETTRFDSNGGGGERKDTLASLATRIAGERTRALQALPLNSRLLISLLLARRQTE